MWYQIVPHLRGKLVLSKRQMYGNIFDKSLKYKYKNIDDVTKAIYFVIFFRFQYTYFISFITFFYISYLIS